MAILREQLRKISTFIVILFLLFAVNIIFNLNYQWEGISLIVRVYLFVFSFYLIYNFSIIDIGLLKRTYKAKYGFRGNYILFLLTRIAPIGIIYLAIVGFTLINYLGTGNWPLDAILNLLNGRNLNIVIYSVVLLLILRIKKDPKVTIPLFLATSVFYLFILDKLIYMYFQDGIVITGVKILKLVIIIYFLIYEFFFAEKVIIKSMVIAILMGASIYFSVFGIYYCVYRFSDFASFAQELSASTLLRIGYSFPLEGLEAMVFHKAHPGRIEDLIYYSQKYKKDIVLSNEEWEKLLTSGRVSTAELVSGYILSREGAVTLSYNKLMVFAEVKAEGSGSELLQAGNFTKYMSKLHQEHVDDFFMRLNKGSLDFRLWGLQVAAESKKYESIPYLVDLLTDINPVISRKAYVSLVAITGMDPIKKSSLYINSPEVVKIFNDFYLPKDKAQ
ncbi:MAG: hypothetical protein GY754_46980 [bacterium]|nr:hypothetical protein [bacterium]